MAWGEMVAVRLIGTPSSIARAVWFTRSRAASVRTAVAFCRGLRFGLLIISPISVTAHSLSSGGIGKGVPGRVAIFTIRRMSFRWSNS
jgi:hypothetical protein